MIDRLLIILLAVVLVALLLLALRLGAVVRQRRATRMVAPEGLAPRDGRPVLLTFSTPGCVDCRYRQAPAVEHVRAEIGPAAHVRHVDAAREPELAARFGILTAPSTVVLAPNGRVAARNDGFAPAETLLAQLRSVASPMPCASR